MEQAIPDQDVDLLMLAAKAAGITIDFPCGMYDPMLAVKDEFGNYRWWNPIIDDGDALRLAVKLKFDIRFTEIDGLHEVEVHGPWDGWFSEDTGSDHYAATRRAIVRAAAEIGRQMEGGAK